MAELRKLADKCKFGNHLEEALRDRLVCGLRQEVIQRKLLTLEDPVTLKKVYDTALGMEVAQERANELQVSGRADGLPVNQVHPPKPPKPPAPPRRLSDLSCERCGKSGHTPDKCYFKNQRCRACGRRGHIAKVCRSKPAHYVGDESASGTEIETTPISDTTDQFLFNIKTVKSRKAGIMVDVKVDGKVLSMELDTGAATSLITEKTWRKVFPNLSLDKSTVRLRTYTGESLHILGQKDVLAEYNDQKRTLPLVVVAGDGPTLFGLNWLDEITLDWGLIKSVK